MKVTLCSKNQTTACKPSIKEQYCESSYLYRRDRNKTEDATVNDTHNVSKHKLKKSSLMQKGRSLLELEVQ